MLDRLLHPSARGDRTTASRHLSFILSQFAASLVSLAVLLCFIIAEGHLHGVTAAAAAWFLLPALAGATLWRTGRLDIAFELSAITLAGFAVIGAALWGGVGMFVAAWLMIVPLEAALSSNRRVILFAALLAAAVLIGLAAADAVGLFAQPQISESNLVLLDRLGTLAAIVYGAGIVARLNGMQHAAILEAELAEDRYRLLADHATDLITCHDGIGRVIFASGAAGRLIGASPASLHANGLLERVHIGDRPLFLSALSECAHKGKDRSVEVRLRSELAPGGTIWTEIRCRPLRGGLASDGTSGAVAVTRDITARKAQEQELREARDSADSANRAKSHFLASMSHELRTPLNSIIGFSSMMTGQTGRPLPPDRVMDYSRMIQTSGEHLLQLVNDLLDISRIEAGRYEISIEPLELAPLVKECLEIVGPQAGKKRLSLMTSVGAELPEILADRRAVRQMLLNLLSNAIKFNCDGGSVRVIASASASGLDLSVSDTGIGIAPEDIARLGTPFVQADRGLSRRYEGAGLGLSIVRGLMRMHGGDLTIESVMGRGTTVRLAFSQIAPPAGEPAPPFLTSETLALDGLDRGVQQGG